MPSVADIDWSVLPKADVDEGPQSEPKQPITGRTSDDVDWSVLPKDIPESPTFFGSLAKAAVAPFKAAIKAPTLTTMTDDELGFALQKEQASRLSQKPPGLAAKAGSLIGGIAGGVGEFAGAEALGTAATGSPIGGTVAAAGAFGASGAYESAINAGVTALDQGKSVSEAVKIARSMAKVGGVVGAGTAALLPGGTVTKGIGKLLAPETTAAAEAVTQSLGKQVVKQAVGGAAVGAGGQVVENIAEKELGLDVSPLEGVVEQGIIMSGLPVLLHARKLYREARTAKSKGDVKKAENLTKQADAVAQAAVESVDTSKVPSSPEGDKFAQAVEAYRTGRSLRMPAGAKAPRPELGPGGVSTEEMAGNVVENADEHKTRLDALQAAVDKAKADNDPPDQIARLQALLDQQKETAPDPNFVEAARRVVQGKKPPEEPQAGEPVAKPEPPPKPAPETVQPKETPDATQERQVAQRDQPEHIETVPRGLPTETSGGDSDVQGRESTEAPQPEPPAQQDVGLLGLPDAEWSAENLKKLSTNRRIQLSKSLALTDKQGLPETSPTKIAKYAAKRMEQMRAERATKQVQEPAKDTVESLWEQYDNTGEIGSAQELASRLESLENLPKNIQRAIDKYKAAIEENYDEFGGRGGITEEPEEQFLKSVEMTVAKARKKAAPESVTPTVTETTPPVPASEMPKTPTETGLRPAIRLVGGKVVVGDAGKTHPDIIKEHGLKAEDIDQRGFVTEDGQFKDREQSAAITPEIPTSTEEGRRHSTDLPEAKKPFEVDDKLIMRSPHTGEDTIVNYRGKPSSGQAMVWTGKSQFQVPESWLRRQGEKYEEPTPTKTTDVPKQVQVPPKGESGKPVGDVGRGKTSTYLGYSIESTPEAVQVGYSTATKLFGKGRKIGGFDVIQPDGYRRHFDTLKAAKQWIDQNPIESEPQSDSDRYKELTTRVRDQISKGQEPDPAITAEIEQIKNRNKGMPPVGANKFGAKPVWLDSLPAPSDSGDGLIRKLWDLYQGGNTKARFFLGPDDRSIYTSLEPIRELIREYPTELKKALAEPTPPPAPKAPEPAASAEKAAGKVEEQVQPTASTETPAQQKKGFDSKQAKEQKKFLLAEIDKAIEEAPESKPGYETAELQKDNDLVNERFKGEGEYKDFAAKHESDLQPLFEKYNIPTQTKPYAGFKSMSGEITGAYPARDLEFVQRESLLREAIDNANRALIPKVVIEVPGDGTFTIYNTKGSLESFKEKAAQFPTTSQKPATKVAGKSRETPTAPAKVGDLSKENITKAASLNVSSDPSRFVITQLWSDGKQTVATDGRRLLIVDKGIGGTEKKPLVQTPEGKKLAGEYPNWKQIPPKEFKEMIKGVDTARLFNIASQAEQATTEKSESIVLVKNPDGSIGVRAGSEGTEFEYAHNIQEGQQVIGAFNVHYLKDALNSARLVGDDKVTLKWNDNLAPISIEGKNSQTVLMPMRLAAAPELTGIAVPEVERAITATLGTDKLPDRIQIINDPEAPFAAVIEGRDRITVNAAKVGNDPVRVIMEEGLHGVWDHTDVQKAWDQFRKAVTDADVEAERKLRADAGIPADEAALREEAAIRKLLDMPETPLAQRVWNAVVNTFKKLFGFDVTDNRQKLMDAARDFLMDRRAPGESQTRYALPPVPAAGPVPPAVSKVQRLREKIGGELERIRETAKTRLLSGRVREAIAYLRDAGGTRANLFGRRMANDVRQPMKAVFGSQIGRAEDALSFVVESKGDRSTLDQWRAQILNSPDASPFWKKKAVDAIDMAIYKWNELQPFADRYKAITDTQVDRENQSGIDTLKRGGYVMHEQDIVDPVISAAGGGGDPTGFRKVRTHDDFASSISAGVDPKSINAIDLLQTRVSRGEKLINNRAWVGALGTMTDPTTRAPISIAPVIVTRADGSHYPSAPSGYSLEYLNNQPVAIHKGYEGLISSVTNPSAFSNSLGAQSLMKWAGAGKSISLLFDTFHLGRVAFWDSLIKATGVRTFKAPFPSYKRGLTLADFTISQIHDMANRGEIPQNWVSNLVQEKTRLNHLVNGGYNIGRISDAMYQDVIHNLPVLGKFNKWLFDSFQRGAMVETGLLEFERLASARPGLSEQEIGRIVAKDLNTRFGNLGRQGLFKSRTFQDLSRLFILAPQWNEGLIKSELGAVKQLGSFAFDTARGKKLYAGVLLRSVGGMAVAQFAANQIINMITRGHPTWENPEEGMGAKLSAWIPDKIGSGSGFFLNPLGLAAETTHLLMSKFEKTADFRTTLNSYLRSRSSTAMRPVMDFITNEDFLGRKLKPGAVWGQMAQDAIPRPIGGAAYLAGAKQAATGKEQESFAGQFQKQLMASFGIKTDQAPNPTARIATLARDFNRQKGITPSAEFYSGDYSPLSAALAIGNEDDAQKAMKELLKHKTREQIEKHFQQWPNHPFTGQRGREYQFKNTLTPEQKDQYRQAVQDRRKIGRDAMKLLRESRP